MPETSFEREVLDRLTKIEAKIDGYGKLEEKVLDSEKDLIGVREDISQLKKSISEIEDNKKWLWRTVGGVIISSGIALIYAFIKMGM